VFVNLRGQINEALAKVLCHNICVLIRDHELGVEIDLREAAHKGGLHAHKVKKKFRKGLIYVQSQLASLDNVKTTEQGLFQCPLWPNLQKSEGRGRSKSLS
jgi:hypothetical protein